MFLCGIQTSAKSALCKQNGISVYPSVFLNEANNRNLYIFRQMSVTYEKTEAVARRFSIGKVFLKLS